MFNEGQDNVHDKVQSGRPSLVNDDLVHMVDRRIHEARHFRISAQSLDLAQISRILLYDTVRNHLGYQKLCMCFDISDVLPQGRRQHVEPYCDRR
jgi:hypothetical protein